MVIIFLAGSRKQAQTEKDQDATATAERRKKRQLVSLLSVPTQSDP